MKPGLLLAGLAAVAMVASGAASAAPAKKRAAPAARTAPAAKDWTKSVVATPEGGFRMGNPNAPVKLVEYGSLTCPACAKFSRESDLALTSHIRSGKLNFEFRNLVLNGADLTAALLTRCAGPANFFPLTQSLLASQSQWMGKITGLSQAQKDAIQALPASARLGRLAELGGLTQLAAGAGVTPQKAKACLADEAGLARLVQMREAATVAGINGTPAFLVNGAQVHAHSWGELQPLLKLPGG